ncbi:crystal protein ET79 [Fusarium flagelliforme]|uniref:crystal protein ET79 n=1 Tax=Fusarium flagelliforme TaxID=2675880 RepID=UPI001E8EAA94|nr:crystal protein ET79 [Fusarium flagelliforme]KAH7193882.1 crystal protein ET79 [Fusarium flagelliforme]
MPARSTFATIINNTSLELELEKDSLSHGEWSDGQDPPSSIAPNNQGTLQAESAGFMTGDEGSLIYSSDAGIFTFQFDNPWNGSNSYDETSPDGYTVNRSGGGGDNASVTWTIESSN